ncbi:hypothetical protein FACS1894185_7040 [Betaproteobacteria bacterium]|nr:hypothetical protein FACS1894185_7040 [Betaproteobacteria bacterium]GHU14852.1 hypothetical protein FACS189441_5540 [Betaproteobacteria bacterium]
MRAKKKQFNATLNREIEIRELTLGEIRAWLKTAETRTPDVVSTLLIADDGIDVALAASDISGNELEALTPSEIKTIVEEIKALNADFFALPARMRELVAGIKQLEEKTPANASKTGALPS